MSLTGLKTLWEDNGNQFDIGCEVAFLQITLRNLICLFNRKEE